MRLTSSFWALEISVRAFVSRVRLTLRMFCSSCAERVGLLDHAQSVVLDVSQVALLLLVDAGDLHQADQHVGQWLGGALEEQHLARELVDAL